MNLSEGIAEYVSHKRLLGLKYVSGESLFKAFLVRTGDIELSAVTAYHVSDHLNAGQPMAHTWLNKYHLLLRFFDFWIMRGAIPPITLPEPKLAKQSPYIPHIYSREQIRTLLVASSRLKQRYKYSTAPQTIRALILFLYATGASVGEALAVETSDVDFRKGMVTLRANRQNRPRTIPICKDLVVVMQRHERWRRARGIDCGVFFVKNDGQPLRKSSLNCTFRRLCDFALVRRMEGIHPRMRDFRPTFAVHRISSWMRTKADLNKLLPALAVYMGHSKLCGTQKYLSLTPDRFRKQLNKLSPTRRKGAWRKDKNLIAFLSSLPPSTATPVGRASI